MDRVPTAIPALADGFAQHHRTQHFCCHLGRLADVSAKSTQFVAAHGRSCRHFVGCWVGRLARSCDEVGIKGGCELTTRELFVLVEPEQDDARLGSAASNEGEGPALHARFDDDISVRSRSNMVAGLRRVKASSASNKREDGSSSAASKRRLTCHRLRMLNRSSHSPVRQETLNAKLVEHSDGMSPYECPGSRRATNTRSALRASHPVVSSAQKRHFLVRACKSSNVPRREMKTASSRTGLSPDALNIKCAIAQKPSYSPRNEDSPIATRVVPEALTSGARSRGAEVATPSSFGIARGRIRRATEGSPIAIRTCPKRPKPAVRYRAKLLLYAMPCKVKC